MILGVPSGDIEEYREVKKQLHAKFGSAALRICIVCLVKALGFKEKKVKGKKK